MITEIKASFDDLTIKAGKATAKFVVLPSAKGFTELTKIVGQTVVLTVETEQAELPFDVQDTEPIPLDECDYEFQEPRKPANVDCETGEIYEEITDGARMIGDGNGND